MTRRSAASPDRATVPFCALLLAMASGTNAQRFQKAWAETDVTLAASRF